MLALAILTLFVAFVVAGSSTVAGVGVGALFFAAGFLVIGVIAGLQFLRARTPTVF